MRWLVLLATLSLIAQDDDEDIIARHAASASEAMQAGDYALAEKHNRAVIRLRPELAEAEVNLGLSLYLQKKYEEAIHAFEDGLKRKPEMANAWLFLGISRFNLNRPKEALPALQRYTAERPQDVEGRYFLGLTYLALERPADAEKPLLAARAIDPRNIDVLYHLAQCYLGQARHQPDRRDSFWQPFERTVHEIAAIDSKSFRISQLRAGYYEAAGKKQEAVHELETLLESDPKVRGLHYTLGCLYMERVQHEKAREQFEAETRLDAPYPRTYFQLGHVYVALQNPAQAITLLRKAMAVEPENTGLVWVEMGRAYRALRQPDQAIAAFEKAIELGERNASVYYQLAMAAKSAGNSKLSRGALEISQKLRSEENSKHAATP